MNRILSRSLSGAAALLLVAAGVSELQAQTTFTACRVPDVGAIYMIGVAGAPTECLEPTHVEFSWTEGGEPADGSITTAKLADGAVTSAKLDPGISIGVGPGEIGTTELADDAVTSAKIVDGAVTSDDIADASIGAADLSDGSVGSAAIGNGSIGTADLATGSATSAIIANGAITGAKLSTSAFQWAQVSSGASVLGSSGGVTASSSGTGTYEVSFPVSLGSQSACAHIATAIEGDRYPVVIHGARFGGGNSTLRVRMYNAVGALTDSAFNLLVVCQ